ncbi:Pentatricopeptide repeat-containing protein [Apostasia shenzhenica]|uniref:Pentatricopeptide repeat-containing protein n=1 Tax=Apostasia shenzhenica TaxID=1088818 RepID=A0A2I0AGV0_9ASPA|nr:Pentatricopeptide repeat-containing protein [Apostasia shenzhenica]
MQGNLCNLTAIIHRSLRRPEANLLSTLRFLSCRWPRHLDADPDSLDSPQTSSSATAGGGGDDFSSDVEKIYRILRNFHARPRQLDLALRDSGVAVRPGLLDRVLSRCGPAAGLAFSFFSWLSRRRPDLSFSEADLRSLLFSLARARHFGPAWALLDRMRREAPEALTVDVFVVLIRRFAASRMVAKAVQVLDEMPAYGLPPDDYVFACLLDALCKNGAVKEAASLFRDMRERFPPNIRHFTSLLYGWCQGGKLEEAKFVLVQMREAGFDPDIVVYNTLLAGFAAAGKMEDGYALLEDMRRKRCEPNAVSYTTLIQSLCSRGRLDDALKVFVEMRKNECIPDSVTYNTLITGFCKSGRLDRGYEFLEAMEAMANHGCRPNPDSFFPIFASHEQNEDLDECLELMSRMRRARCLPDLGIYNVVIRLSCKLGELRRAESIWNEMEAGGLSPGLDTFVIIIHGFINQNSMIEACKYFKEMAARGLLSSPQYGTMKELLNSVLRAGKLELAKEVWSSMAVKGCELNVHAWTIWIHALFSNNHVKEACYYCLEMMDAGLMPQPDTFVKLMKGLRKLYNRQIAAEITEKVRAMVAERNVSFKMYKRRGEMDLERKKMRARRKIKCSRRQQHRRRGNPSRQRQESPV